MYGIIVQQLAQHNFLLAILVLNQLLHSRKLDMAGLQRPCEQGLFLYLTKHIAHYDEAARHLGLTIPETVAIKNEESHDVNKKLAMLNKWQSKNGTDATYYQLILTFLQMENHVLAEKILQYYISTASNNMPHANPKKLCHNWKNVKTDKKQKIRKKLLAEYEQICDTYSNVVLDIATQFERSNIEPQHLMLILKTYITAYCSRSVSTNLIESSKRLSESVHETFSFIARHTSWFNYQLLEVVVDELGNDEAKELLGKYKKEHMIPYIKMLQFFYSTSAWTGDFD